MASAAQANTNNDVTLLLQISSQWLRTLHRMCLVIWLPLVAASLRVFELITKKIYLASKSIFVTGGMYAPYIPGMPVPHSL